MPWLFLSCRGFFFFAVAFSFVPWLLSACCSFCSRAVAFVCVSLPFCLRVTLVGHRTMAINQCINVIIVIICINVTTIANTRKH